MDTFLVLFVFIYLVHSLILLIISIFQVNEDELGLSEKFNLVIQVATTVQVRTHRFVYATNSNKASKGFKIKWVSQNGRFIMLPNFKITVGI